MKPYAASCLILELLLPLAFWESDDVLHGEAVNGITGERENFSTFFLYIVAIIAVTKTNLVSAFRPYCHQKLKHALY